MARFGEESYWESRKPRKRQGCGLWKSITVGNEDFWKFISFSLGSGENICFWNDLWVGVTPLKVTFPITYRLALVHKASVDNCYDFNKRCWDPRLRREPNDWKVGEMIRLLETLGNSILLWKNRMGWSRSLIKRVTLLISHTIWNYQIVHYFRSPIKTFRILIFL